MKNEELFPQITSAANAFEVERGLDRCKWIRARIHGENYYDDLDRGALSKKPFLVLVDDMSGEAVHETYKPLECSVDLFIELANVAPTCDGVLDFVKKWGQLGREHLLEIADHGRGQLKYGEVFDDWLIEIHDMKQTLSVWEAWKSKDKESVKRCVKWNEVEGTWQFNFNESAGVFCGNPDVLTAASIFIESAIDSKIRKNCEPTFQCGYAGEFSIGIVPANLLGAIWWQFAQRLTGTVVLCRVCSNPIQRSKERSAGKRLDAQVCSMACHSKEHRLKVKEAKALLASGMKPAAIAKQLNTSVETINRWLTKKK